MSLEEIDFNKEFAGMLKFMSALPVIVASLSNFHMIKLCKT